MRQDAIDAIKALVGRHEDVSNWKYCSMSERYLASTSGQIISLIRAKRLLKQTISTTGYYYVSIMVDDKPIKRLVHALVGECFLGGRPESAKTINHINGDKLDNRVENLEWASYKENNDHAKNITLNKCYCENHHHARLTNESVMRIRDLAGKLTPNQLSEIYGVRAGQIRKIINGEAWARLL